MVSTLDFDADDPGSIPYAGAGKEIFLLLSSASEGIVSSRPRASVARVSCN